MRALSAPRRFDSFVKSIASLVEFAPDPAITGILLLVCFTVKAITSKCSLTFNVADSPVVPTETIPSVP